jgi:hypothetical protein
LAYAYRTKEYFDAGKTRQRGSEKKCQIKRFAFELAAKKNPIRFSLAKYGVWKNLL